MNDFLENFKTNVKQIGKNIWAGYSKLVGRPAPKDGSVVSTETESTYEINLVPEIKAQMIKALKIRNMVLFVCIVVSAVAGGAVLVLLGVKSGQDIAMANQDKKLETLSGKLNGYTELPDLLTIQAQLLKYAELTNSKTVPSRVFGALGVMMMQKNDSIKMSDVRVNLETSTITLEGQANALVDPLIDYRVLEAFKKSVDLTKYDYGRYVDIDGIEIPTYCIEETDSEGTAYRKGDSYYAWWNLQLEGCEGLRRELSLDYEEADYHYGSDAEIELGVKGYITTETKSECDENKQNCKSVIINVIKRAPKDEDSDTNENTNNTECAPDDAECVANKEQEQQEEKNEDGLRVITGEKDGVKYTITGPMGSEKIEPVPIKVKIWRTPQFNAWYRDGELALNGNVTGIEHFESECVKYKGTELESGTIRWSSTNDCLLAPEGLTIKESSNGRDEAENLVLKFSAVVTFDEEFFRYVNKHMIAIGPMGQNVTDSFVQIGNMFTKEAESCAADDIECLTTSSGGTQ